MVTLASLCMGAYWLEPEDCFPKLLAPEQTLMKGLSYSLQSSLWNNSYFLVREK